MSKKSESLSDLNKKDRNKRHSSPFINVVKGVFFVVRVTLVPVSYLSAPSAVHSYRVPGKFIRRLKSLFVGWKVYSSSTNKAKIYSYSIFVQQMYWLQDKKWYHVDIATCQMYHSLSKYFSRWPHRQYLTFDKATWGNASQLNTVSSPVLPSSWPLNILAAVTVDIPIPSPNMMIVFLARPMIGWLFKAACKAFFAFVLQYNGAKK